MNKVQGHHRYLVSLPWLQQGLFTGLDAGTAYARIRYSFEQSGFRLSAVDDKRKRFSAYRERGTGDCTCIHVVWVRTHQRSAYVSFAIEPRFLSFRFCRHGDHLVKLQRCGSAIRAAVASELVRESGEVAIGEAGHGKGGMGQP